MQSCPANCFFLAPLISRYSPLEFISAGRDEPSDQSDMVMIDPEECTNCGACETECPMEAIFEDCLVPEELANWIGINASYTRSLSVERKI
ncbi:4Fe-4S dicluster domain-containing protein [Celeribacter sp.]|uniref:4Fe-4S dicluster domain-containing protein n=1 Tax=Pseudomonadati TaxID=3379134 RepID=UPI003A936B50